MASAAWICAPVCLILCIQITATCKLKTIFTFSFYAKSFGKKYFFTCLTLCLLFLSFSTTAQQKKNLKSDDAIEQKIEAITESINQDAESDKEMDFNTLLDKLNY